MARADSVVLALRELDALTRDESVGDDDTGADREDSRDALGVADMRVLVDALSSALALELADIVVVADGEDVDD